MQRTHLMYTRASAHSGLVSDKSDLIILQSSCASHNQLTFCKNYSYYLGNCHGCWNFSNISNAPCTCQVTWHLQLSTWTRAQTFIYFTCVCLRCLYSDASQRMLALLMICSEVPCDNELRCMMLGHCCSSVEMSKRLAQEGLTAPEPCYAHCCTSVSTQPLLQTHLSSIAPQKGQQQSHRTRYTRCSGYCNGAMAKP